MRPILVVIVLLLVLGVAGTLRAQGIGWSLVNWKVRRDFPSVPRITPAEAAALLNDERASQPLLLDVRTKAEYEISHLPGARRVAPDSDPGAINLPRDRRIITYCSVGYRSGAFAKKLQDAGYKNVRNMSGSIFQWANEGRPLVQNGKRVRKVHPYNGLWGKLLQPALRADVPDAGKEM